MRYNEPKNLQLVDLVYDLCTSIAYSNKYRAKEKCNLIYDTLFFTLYGTIVLTLTNSNQISSAAIEANF